VCCSYFVVDTIPLDTKVRRFFDGGTVFHDSMIDAQLLDAQDPRLLDTLVKCLFHFVSAWSTGLYTKKHRLGRLFCHGYR